MVDPSPRLASKREPLLKHPQQPIDDSAWSDIAMPRQRQAVRSLRALRRTVVAVLWTGLAACVQSLLLLLPRSASRRFALLYWWLICRIIGVNVATSGRVAERVDGRPVVFVSNHSSWLDIPVLGGRLYACFVAKQEVQGWPIIRTVARLGRTVYVRRSRASIGRERDDMGRRLSEGDNLVLFPEGTTSDGSRVLAFHSGLLSVAERAVTQAGRRPIVQPVSVVYDRLAGLPMGRSSRPVFAWYGDMEFAPHFWNLAQHRGLRATLVLHPPVDPESFADRKALAAALWAIVAGGAATLRQNRPITQTVTGLSIDTTPGASATLRAS